MPTDRPEHTPRSVEVRTSQAVLAGDECRVRGVQTPDLVERTAALDALEAALHAAARRRGSVVLVTGEAGAGRTALVTHVADRHHDEDPGADRTVRRPGDGPARSRTCRSRTEPSTWSSPTGCNLIPDEDRPDDHRFLSDQARAASESYGVRGVPVLAPEQAPDQCPEGAAARSPARRR